MKSEKQKDFKEFAKPLRRKRCNEALSFEQQSVPIDGHRRNVAMDVRQLNKQYTEALLTIQKLQEKEIKSFYELASTKSKLLDASKHIKALEAENRDLRKSSRNEAKEEKKQNELRLRNFNLRKALNKIKVDRTKEEKKHEETVSRKDEEISNLKTDLKQMERDFNMEGLKMERAHQRRMEIEEKLKVKCQQNVVIRNGFDKVSNRMLLLQSKCMGTEKSRDFYKEETEKLTNEIETLKEKVVRSEKNMKEIVGKHHSTLLKVSTITSEMKRSMTTQRKCLPSFLNRRCSMKRARLIEQLEDLLHQQSNAADTVVSGPYDPGDDKQ